MPREILDEFVRRDLLEVAKMQDLEAQAEEVSERAAQRTRNYPPPQAEFQNGDTDSSNTRIA